MDLHARQLRIKLEIERQARAMGGYHGPLFEERCHKRLAEFLALSDDEMSAVVATLSREWMADVKGEQERIRDIDNLAATLSPGHEKLVHAAKFIEPCTAGELAERIIAANRDFLHRMPSAKQ